MVNVVFLHPNLGIGGAERLIVDAALSLRERGHSVHILTAHHDPGHSFPETNDGTLLVTTVGDWLPHSLFGGRFFAVCAYLRMIYISIYLVLFSRLACDVAVVDQISVCVPILKSAKLPVLFYCHFPDQLLTVRKSLLKKLYRVPIDWLEEMTTGMADKIVVNSRFTGGMFHDTFKRLTVEPEVLYPALNFSIFDRPAPHYEGLKLDSVRTLFLSINRYERKKNIGLALKAMALLRNNLDVVAWHGVHLVIAGGYDSLVEENINYHRELELLADALRVIPNVTFLKSISDDEKRALLHSCTCLIYTPANEHFGIVPIEAMAMGRPVLAVNSGGPTETITDAVSGYLRDPVPEDFAEAMKSLIRDKDLAREMGQAGKDIVRKKFASESFGRQLENLLMSLVNQGS